MRKTIFHSGALSTQALFIIVLVLAVLGCSSSKKKAEAEKEQRTEIQACIKSAIADVPGIAVNDQIATRVSDLYGTHDLLITKYKITFGMKSLDGTIFLRVRKGKAFNVENILPEFLINNIKPSEQTFFTDGVKKINATIASKCSKLHVGADE